jgi:RNA polymerase sigma-70 factor (ECF subfamily)
VTDIDSTAGPEQNAAEHWPAAYGLAWALVGDHGRAEELAQEAYLRVARAANGSVRADRAQWLAIVRNLAIDSLRRAGHESLDDAPHGSTAAARDLDPGEQAEARERRLVVREALATLSPSWRATLYLRDGLGLSYRQIAETLDRSEDVVRVTLHRARARMREWIEPRMPEGERR